VSHDGAIEPRDELQARVVERLRAAHGAPVAFSELRAMGIENPALLGYELAAAGLPIEQVREWGSRALMLDRLAEPPEGMERSEEQPGRRGAGDGAVGSVSRDRLRRLSLRPASALRPGRAGAAASAAMVVALAALLAITLGAHSARQPPRLSADQPRHSAARSHAANAGKHALQTSSAAASSLTRVMPAQPAANQRSVAVSPAGATSLEAAGHQLLSRGRYAQAIGALREAVQASGGSVARCAEPTSKACLTFAYALYDLCAWTVTRTPRYGSSANACRLTTSARWSRNSLISPAPASSEPLQRHPSTEGRGDRRATHGCEERQQARPSVQRHRHVRAKERRRRGARGGNRRSHGQQGTRTQR
jgi:hypothetical protein